MNKYWELLAENIWINKIIWSLLWLLILMVVARSLNSIWKRQISDAKKFYQFRKMTYYILTTIYMVLMLFVWLELAGSLTVYLGFLSAGMAIALKDFFSNIVAWLFIVLRRPFKIGDRVVINGQRGDVIDIRVFQFSLIEVSSPEEGEQSTGCIIDVPNNFVFLYPIVNLVKGFEFIWNEFELKLTPNSDWRKVKEELVNIAIKHTEQYMEAAQEEMRLASGKYLIYYNNLSPIVYTSVSGSEVVLTLRYICSPRMKRNTTNDIWESVLEYIEQTDNVQLI